MSPALCFQFTIGQNTDVLPWIARAGGCQHSTQSSWCQSIWWQSVWLLTKQCCTFLTGSPSPEAQMFACQPQCNVVALLAILLSGNIVMLPIHIWSGGCLDISLDLFGTNPPGGNRLGDQAVLHFPHGLSRPSTLQCLHINSVVCITEHRFHHLPRFQ